ncbi:MAG: hypothetical protein RBG13Loki_1715 [Promethearchaeota archaeon CR_4]|nr:MAG: hypothetical protein RBG13Loki_1715 [Candidatus Lokiarchaeota archaeon CR_4]
MSLDKELADDTLLKRERQKNFVSSGIRELDEMIGGGFRLGSLTLIQESVGAGGVVLLKNIIEVQLALANRVLVIYTDPTLQYYISKLEAMHDPNLSILNLLPKGAVDTSFNRHDINLRIKAIRSKLFPSPVPVFVVMLTLNPFFLNFEEEQVIRIVYENLVLTLQYKTIDLVLLQKGLVSEGIVAKLQSLSHGVIDLTSQFEGTNKQNTIRILKMVETVPDANVVPYEIFFDKYTQKERFIINTAFLTSFETFRSLIKWRDGETKLSQYPYLIAPVHYFNSFLEIALNLNPVKGRIELLEKAQGIGRKLAKSVERTYFLSGSELLRACIRTISLQGWGAGQLKACELEENLIIIGQRFPNQFNEEPYQIFMEGFYRGVIKTILGRNVRSAQFERKEEGKNGRVYEIQFRLELIREEEDAHFAEDL